MGLEPLKCTNCGSAAIKEVKQDTYFCVHCEGVFKYIPPAPRDADKGRATTTCDCGNLVSGKCVLCGQARCHQHLYTMVDFVICRSCRGRRDEVAHALDRASQSARRAGLDARDAEYRSRPPIPYDAALAWLSGKSPDPQGYRWGSFTARQLANLLVGAKRAPSDIRLRRPALTGWVLEQDGHEWESHWERWMLTKDAHLWREYRREGRRTSEVEHYGQPDSVVPENFVARAISLEIDPKPYPDPWRFTFQAWLNAGKPDLEGYLRGPAD